MEAGAAIEADPPKCGGSAAFDHKHAAAITSCEACPLRFARPRDARCLPRAGPRYAWPCPRAPLRARPRAFLTCTSSSLSGTRISFSWKASSGRAACRAAGGHVLDHQLLLGHRNLKPLDLGMDDVAHPGLALVVRDLVRFDLFLVQRDRLRLRSRTIQLLIALPARILLVFPLVELIAPPG